MIYFMVIETKKENLCVNQSIAEKEVIAQISGDIIIPDSKPDILNAVNTSGNVCIYKKDIMDGKIRLDGSVNVDVIYMTDGETNTVRGLRTSLDFTEVIDVDNARQGMYSNEEISIQLIECQVLNGRKINLKATVKIKTKVFSNDNLGIISEIGNMQDIQILSQTSRH